MQIFLDPTSTDKHIISLNYDYETANGNANDCHFWAGRFLTLMITEIYEFPHQQNLGLNKALIELYRYLVSFMNI